MEPNPQFWAGKRVCVTGGTGFLGWVLVRQLLPLTRHVRILGLPPASKALAAKLQPLDCVFGDVRDPATVRQALRDCDVVFHTAGTVATWGPALTQMREIHVRGTQEVLQALAPKARLVHTSSVVAVGASHGRDAMTEDSLFSVQSLKVDYVHAKRQAEQLALAAAGLGQDVVVANPAYLIGPEDHEKSVMGRLCLRGWKGKIKMAPPGGLNFVDVRDAARGHLLAAERGRAGERYILGGENLTLAEFVLLLATVRGLVARTRFVMPQWLQTIVALVGEICGRLMGREPSPSLHQARMNRYFWYYSSERARAELGYHSRSVKESLLDAHQWFCQELRLAPGDGGPRLAPDIVPDCVLRSQSARRTL
jgi:dihydroflavonol-4-reductase